MIIEFKYLNHAGKVADRKVDVDALEFFFEPMWGYQPGWFISGLDQDKMARRSFALNRIIFPEADKAQRILQFKLG